MVKKLDAIKIYEIAESGNTGLIRAGNEMLRLFFDQLAPAAGTRAGNLLVRTVVSGTLIGELPFQYRLCDKHCITFTPLFLRKKEVIHEQKNCV